MKAGYMRVSREEQNLDLQRDSLTKAGCDRIFEDKLSGAIDERPGLKEALGFLREGDELVVWRLDRLGRSLQHLVAVVNELECRGVQFSSLTEQINTSSPGGRLTFHIFGALAEFERDLIRSRTRAGLEAARARGRIGGRPEKLDSTKIKLARAMLSDGTTSSADVCRALNVSRATLYRHMRASGSESSE